MSGADAGPVAILTALAEESRPLRRRMSDVRRMPGGATAVWEGSLGARQVLLAETGAGARAAGAGAADVFARFSPARWVGAGFAGALSPGLPFGSLVVATELAGGGGGAAASLLDSAMALRALACDAGARAVRAADSPGIVGSREEKARLLAAAGGSLPVTVDMESRAWMRAAAGVPGIVVRVVTDSAEEEIPDIVAASASGGGIDRRKLVRSAVLHPFSIGKLLALRRRARTCGELLADFVARFAARRF